MSRKSNARRLPPKLLVLSPGDLSTSNAGAWLNVARRCIDAGLRGILLREPGISDALRLSLALHLRDELSARDGYLALHDAPHLAQVSRADAVHFGFRSLPLDEVRHWTPPTLALGLSTHHGDPLDRPNPDYAFYGPVFDTPSKAGLKDAVGLVDLQERCRASSAPVWGLGGIDPSSTAQVLQCGVAGLAVRGALWDVRKPWHRVTEFLGATGDSIV